MALINDGVLKMLDGTYYIAVRIQDGSEWKDKIPTLEIAIATYKDWHEVLNHNLDKNPDIFEIKEIKEYRIVKVN